jgi:hypothetical protein
VSKRRSIEGKRNDIEGIRVEEKRKNLSKQSKDKKSIERVNTISVLLFE